MAREYKDLRLFLAVFVSACVIMCIFHVFVLCLWILLGL